MRNVCRVRLQFPSLCTPARGADSSQTQVVVVIVVVVVPKRRLKLEPTRIDTSLCGFITDGNPNGTDFAAASIRIRRYSETRLCNAMRVSEGLQPTALVTHLDGQIHHPQVGRDADGQQQVENGRLDSVWWRCGGGEGGTQSERKRETGNAHLAPFVSLP